MDTSPPYSKKILGKGNSGGAKFFRERGCKVYQSLQNHHFSCRLLDKRFKFRLRLESPLPVIPT